MTVTPPVTASVTSQTSLGDPSKKIECVNLSDEEDSPVPVKITPVAKPVQVTQARPRPNALTSVRPTAFVSRTNGLGIITHPASLPPMPQRQPSRPGWKLLPAKPSLKINRKGAGIVLSWNLAHTVTHATCFLKVSVWSSSCLILLAASSSASFFFSSFFVSDIFFN